ncbi:MULTISPECIES: MFS transporter [Clostridium]|jgi:MFS transporter, PPP family, 3-phenylpropionic acid transporter|uniref:MFS transporter n=1 Tax=Clostridium TaxID=1485 RepID=UPI001FA8B742|nr:MULTISPECIES: MFS transporter [Clostridium]MDB1934482.1 MFS transporter [Clostridium tertium]MDB1937654.1 MFS transporter [Clostridium tertium]MDB1941977.1 MFS transporter [Clostridium tertium]MDB1943703.1 MFS transporter [Clostridium tertium]MDB1951669.1 MFS transporter [Clostridium tertium]
MKSKKREGRIKIMENLSKKFSNYLLISSLGGNILGSIFVLFLSSIKGFNAKEISLIVGTTPLIIFPIFFLWGSLLDKYQRVVGFSKLVNLSNIITMGLLIITNNFILFFIINIIRSILLQPSGTLNDKYMLNISSTNKGTYGKIRVRSTIGYGLAGIICPIAIRIGDVYLAIIVGMILISFSIILLSKVPEISDNHVSINKNIKNDKGNTFKSLFDLIKNKMYLKYLIIISIIWGTQNAASGYGIQIMMIDLNVSKVIIGLIPFIMVIFEVIFLLVFDKVRILRKNDLALLIALVILVFRWSIMVFAKSYILILIITMLHGIVTGIVLQIQNKIIGKVVSSNQHFLAFMLISSLSTTILPSLLNLITGDLYGKFGIKVFGFVYLVLSLIASFVLIYNALKNKRLKSYEIKN